MILVKKPETPFHEYFSNEILALSPWKTKEIFEENPNIFRQCNKLGRTFIHLLGKGGHVEAAEIFCKLIEDFDVNCLSFESETPLNLAVKGGHLLMCEFLLRKGAIVNLGKTTSFQLAVERENLRICELFIEFKTSPNCRSPMTGETPIFTAIRKKNTKLISILAGNIQKDPHAITNADLEIENIQNLTPLAIAAETGNLDVCLALLFHGARVNPERTVRMTPLCIAAKGNYFDMVKHFLSIGADPNIGMSKKYPSPLFYAIENGSLEISKILLEYKTNCNYVDRKGISLLSIAVSKKRTEIVKLLLSSGAIPNGTRKREPKPPIFYAIENRDIETIDILIKKGANPSCMDNIEGDTPLISAVKLGFIDVVQFLLDNKAKVNNTSRKLGATALYYATSSVRPDICQVLINAGAKVRNSYSPSQFYPLAIARQIGDQNLIELLRKRCTHEKYNY